MNPAWFYTGRSTLERSGRGLRPSRRAAEAFRFYDVNLRPSESPVVLTARRPPTSSNSTNGSRRWSRNGPAAVGPGAPRGARRFQWRAAAVTRARGCACSSTITMSKRWPRGRHGRSQAGRATRSPRRLHGRVELAGGTSRASPTGPARSRVCTRGAIPDLTATASPVTP